MLGYIITSIVSFIIGIIVTSRFKDNVNIGFGNQSINIIENHSDKDNGDYDEFEKF